MTLLYLRCTVKLWHLNRGSDSFPSAEKNNGKQTKDFMISTFNELCFCIGKQSGSDELLIFFPPTITIFAHLCSYETWYAGECSYKLHVTSAFRCQLIARIFSTRLRDSFLFHCHVQSVIECQQRDGSLVNFVQLTFCLLCSGTRSSSCIIRQKFTLWR